MMTSLHQKQRLEAETHASSWCFSACPEQKLNTLQEVIESSLSLLHRPHDTLSSRREIAKD
eukprot:scaffold1049_cov101-Skeletonema_dohrnii-CCMP3373.AAC.1